MLLMVQQMMFGTRGGRRVMQALETRRQAVRGMGSNIGPIGWGVIATVGVLSALGVLHYILIPWMQSVGTNTGGISTTTTGTQP